MAVLAENQRAALWAEFMAELSGEREPLGPLTKADLRAAVDALDAFLAANAAALNGAIPQPARSGLTAAQKARLLVFVVRRRWIAEA